MRWRPTACPAPRSAGDAAQLPGLYGRSSRTILGFGLSSISQFETAYVQNTTDAPTYRAALSAQNLPIQRGCFLSADDRTRRALIERLMCDFSLSFADFPEISVPRDRLAVLEQDGLLRVEGIAFGSANTGSPSCGWLRRVSILTLPLRRVVTPELSDPVYIKTRRAPKKVRMTLAAV